MAALNAPFNPNNYEALSNLSMMSVGVHTVIITADEWEENKQKSGHFLKMILANEDRDTYFVRLNLMHSSQAAIDMANKELTSICQAVGVLSEFSDTSALHGRSFDIEIAYQKDQMDKPEKDRYTEIKRYAPAGTLKVAAPQAAPQQAPAEPPQQAPAQQAPAQQAPAQQAPAQQAPAQQAPAAAPAPAGAPSWMNNG